MHLAYHFQRLAQRFGERPALIENGRTWSFAALLERLNRVGNALYGLGLSRGDRVAILLPDGRAYLECDYGSMAAGLVRVPLDPRLSRQELASQLADSGAGVLIFDAASQMHLPEPAARGGLRLIAVGAPVGDPIDGALDYEDWLASAGTDAPASGDGDELATLNYSGGTTGAPKATMLSHRNLFTVAQSIAQSCAITPEDRFLNVRPLWPIAQVIPTAHLLAGACVILGGRFEPRTFGTLIAATHATRSSLVPTQLVRLIEALRQGGAAIPPVLRALYIGGSRIAPEDFASALALIGPRIGVVYGLTEAPVSCILPPEALADPAQHDRLMRSAGRELIGYELAIKAPDGTHLPVGEEGEVCVRGGNVMQGYWNRAEATAAALRDGWLHTGDIGRVDEEGYLAVVGRLKEVIRTGSSSVVPQEVEDVIAAHPAVAEVAVAGLPDAEWQEIVAAFIVVRPGADLAEAEIVEHCRTHLTGYKRPRAIRFVEALPRSHYGKVLKTQLVTEAGKVKTR